MTTLVFEPLEACFGARVSGVRLASIDDAAFAELYERWLDYGLLVFEGQHLTREEQQAFARRFGRLEIEMAELSNVLADGSLRPDDDSDEMMKIHRGNMSWHHDSTYMPVQAKGAVFCAEVVTSSGGGTGFADMRAAYEALDPATAARLEGLRAHHSLFHSQAKIGHRAQVVDDATVLTDEAAGKSYGGYGFHGGPVSVRPLVKVHPETGRKNLLIGRHAYDIVGMTSDESESLLSELVEFACQAPRVYEHRWAPGDAVLWDNRRLLHRARPWPLDQPRVMWHTRIAGDAATESALAG